ncbi:MAG: IS200/IS605 family transposase [Candidatus Jorgensenbacteria bacterium]
MEYFRQAHAVYHTQYHIVWIPRYRRKILVGGVADHLTVMLQRVRHWYPDLVLHECAIKPDHVHLLVTIPPRMSVSDGVRILKTNTSTALRTKFPFLAKLYPRKEGVWSVGYFASTVGVNEAVIARYLHLQEREDRGQAKLALQKKPRA